MLRTDSDELSVTPPIKLHEVDKKQLAAMQGIVDKVVCRAVVEGLGQDLLLRVYLAGLYHGSTVKRGTDGFTY